MEIADLNIGIGGPTQGPDWGWLQSKIRQNRSASREQLHTQLGELLFGVQLTQRQMLEYRVKLAQVLDIIEEFEAPLPKLRPDLVVPAARRVFPVGSVAWHPSLVQRGEQYSATPVQVLQKRKLLRLQEFMGREGEVCFHRVAIKVAHRDKVSLRGSDQVMLTPAALNEINHPTQPAVTTLRLPPRFYKQVDVLKVSRLGTR